jgi:hypothetical protein
MSTAVVLAIRPRKNPSAWVDEVSRFFETELDEDEIKRFRLNVDGVASSIDPEWAKKIYLTQLLLNGPYSVSAQLRSGFLRRRREARAIREAAACVEANAPFEQMEKCRLRLERLERSARIGSSRDALKAAVAACDGKAMAATKGAVHAVWQATMLKSTLNMDRYLPHRRAAILALSEVFVLALQSASGFHDS